MGLSKYSFTLTNSEVAIYSGNSSTLVSNTSQARECFVSNISVWDDYSKTTSGLYRSARVTLSTDSLGVKNLMITLNGWVYRNGTTTGNWTGPVYWQVTTSANRPNSGWNSIAVTIDSRSNIYSSWVEVNMLPNATYYLWIQHGGNFHWGYGSNGLVIGTSGNYGQPGIISASDGNFGSAISLSYASATPEASPTYTVKTSTVVESGGNNGSTLYEETLQTTDGTSSRNWTPEISTYAPKLPNRASTTCTITVNTYFGGVLAGSSSATITLSFTAASVGPTIATGCFGIAAYNTGAVSGMSGYIQGYSRVRATYDSTKVTLHNATVYEWKVERIYGNEVVGTAHKSATDTEHITYEMQRAETIRLSVVDSRGFTASQSFNFTLLTYVIPALNADYYRCAADSDSPSDTGTRLALYPHVVFSDLNGQNSITFTFEWKYVSANQWTDKTLEANLQNNVKSFLTNFEDRSYNLRMTVTDELGNTAEWLRDIASSEHFLTSTTAWDGAAFGRVAEYSDTLDIGDWELICGNINMNGEDLGTLLTQIKAALNIS